VTKAQPKEMLPVMDKPVIQYVVEEAVAAGCEDVLIITGRGKRAIEDHFDRSVELEDLLDRAGNMQKLKEIVLRAPEEPQGTWACGTHGCSTRGQGAVLRAAG